MKERNDISTSDISRYEDKNFWTGYIHIIYIYIYIYIPITYVY